MTTGWKTQSLTHPPKVDLDPPTVVSLQGRRLADGELYIGREMHGKGLPASDWANTARLTVDTPEARQDAVRAFLNDLLEKSHRSNVGSLAGGRLACWCAPKLCHGNGLVELVAATKWYGARCPHCNGPTKSFLNWHAGLQSFEEAWICQDFSRCARWGREARPIPSLLLRSQPMLL